MNNEGVDFMSNTQAHITIEDQQNSQEIESSVEMKGFKLFMHQQGIKQTIPHENNVILFFTYALSLHFIEEPGNLQESQLITAISKYKQHVDELLKGQLISTFERNRLLHSLDLYVRYLRSNNGINLALNVYLLDKQIPTFDDLGCIPFREYIEELSHLQKPRIKHHIKEIKHFLKFLGPDISQTINTLTQLHMHKLESYLLQRIDDGLILPKSAYELLSGIRRFLRFMNRNQYIHFNYVIPEQFATKISRENSYVTNEDRTSFLDAIMNDENNPQQIRNLCIVLLLMFTGCRSLEICNLRIQDVLQTECMIFLYSKKSSQRALCIDKEVMKVIGLYITHKRAYSDSNDPLFILHNGFKMDSDNISTIISNYNKLVSSQIKVTARALRHTYITNALDDNRNDAREVSKLVGHSSLRSTIHYYYKNIKRLINNASPYLPNIK